MVHKPHREKLSQIRDPRREERAPNTGAEFDGLPPRIGGGTATPFGGSDIAAELAKLLPIVVGGLAQTGAATAEIRRVAKLSERLEDAAFEAWKANLAHIDLSDAKSVADVGPVLAKHAVQVAVAFCDALALAEAPKEAKPAPPSGPFAEGSEFQARTPSKAAETPHSGGGSSSPNKPSKS
jgi:hypothetical protein